MPSKLTITEMQNLARSRGGGCLSKQYINIYTPLQWECEKGHKWYSAPRNVKNGEKWCHVCGGTKKLTLDDMYKIAKQRNGKCLSKKYTNVDTKLKWQCEYGHVWMAKPNDVKNDNTWCPKCRGTKRHGISKMQRIAKERGGKCLSKEYKNIFTKLDWECSRGHRWTASSVGIIHQKQWCPVCSGGSAERLCRLFFENIFNKKFLKIRPKWLRSVGVSRSMEIDGFNRELKLGFEYNGSQHYQVKSKFYKNGIEELRKRKSDDILKIHLAKTRGINIITVPFWIKANEMEKYIVVEARKLGYKVREKGLNYDRFDVNDNEIYENLKRIAESKGGQLLSRNYIDSKTKLGWQCVEGHIFNATPGSIANQGSWCFKCSYKDRNLKTWKTRKKYQNMFRQQK